MDTAPSSPPVSNLVVRVRGTFIDIGPNVPEQSLRRSSSAPPRKGSLLDEEDEAPTDDSQYIEDWLGRAMTLSDDHSKGLQNGSFDGKTPSPARQFQGLADHVCNGQAVKETEEVKTKGISLFGGTAMPTNEAHIWNSAEAWNSNQEWIAADTQYNPMMYQYPTHLYPKCSNVQSGSAPGNWASGRLQPGLDVKGPSLEEQWATNMAPPTLRMPMFPAPMAPCNNWQEAPGRWGGVKDSNPYGNSFFHHGVENTVMAPEPSTLNSKSNFEDPSKYKRLNLSRSGPVKDSNTRWLNENILAKHPQPELPAAAEIAGEITTLMICDIPCRQTVDQIIDAIKLHGFANTFNLVYMPSKRPKYLQNMGYAFVNFKTAEYALAFGKAFQNFRFPTSSSKKLSYTKPAVHQGYTENVDRYIKQRAVGCLVTFDDAVQGGKAQTMYQ